MKSKLFRAVIAFSVGALLLACSDRTHLPVAAHATNSTPNSPSETIPAGTLPLKVVADVPLSGGTTRLDYQSLDSASGRLYIAHLGSDLMTVFESISRASLVR